MAHIWLAEKMEQLIESLPPMDLMRSEEMAYIQLIIPVEFAHRAVSYLGELGLLQFRDLNTDKSPFQRTFANQVKRCGEMSRKLHFFRDQIGKAGIMSLESLAMQPDMELEELEIQLAERENELIEMNSNGERLQQTYNELLEFKMVLEEAGGFLFSGKNHAILEETEMETVESNHNDIEMASLVEKGIRLGVSGQSSVRFISVIICESKVLTFERMLFRATRGNMLFNQSQADEEVVDPITSEKVSKVVFMVFFSGEQAKTKILKICEAFGANCYPVPEDMTKQRQLTREVLSRLSELEVTVDAGIRHRNRTLSTIDFNLTKWMNMVRTEKAV